MLFGEVTSVICHRGDVNLDHFVSYHKVGDQWFLNNDSSPCVLVSDPLEQEVEGETVEILF